MMTSFSYRCLDAQGEVLAGKLEARDRPSAIEELRRRGMIPLDLSSSGPTLAMRLNEPVDYFQRPSDRDVHAFLRDLSRLLNAGLSIDAAFKLLSGMQKKEGFSRTLEEIREKLRQGESLAASLSHYGTLFPVQTTAAIQAGENSGTLAESLEGIAISMDKALSFRERLRSALVYPMILIVMVAATFFLVLTFVLPQFAPMFAGNEDKLPFATKFVMATGDFFANYWGYLVLAFVASILWALAVRKDRRLKGKLFKSLCRIKWLRGWLLEPDLIRFLRTLGVCYSSGLALDKSNAMAIDAVTLPHVADELTEVRAQIRRGDLLSTAFSRLDWFPALALQFTLVGEQSGKLGAMLSEAAGILAQDYETRLESFLGILSPVITLVMGAIVALLIGAVMLGIMSVSDVAF